MTGQLLFYIVFSSQIFLLSVYFPSRIMARIKHVLSHYPPATHAKLYPKSRRYYVRSLTIYKWINALNLILGLILMYFVFSGNLVGEKGISPWLPWGYFMLQMLPSQLLELYSFRLSKLMKQQDTRAIKTATLQPRGLMTYISPTLIFFVLFFYVAFVVFAFYLHNFTLDSKALIMSLVLLAGLLFFLVMAMYLVYGKKCNPYQTQEERDRLIRLNLSVLSYVMIACSVFMGLIAFIDVYELKSSLPVVMSLFLQFLAIISMGYMLHNNRLEDIDFDVYKTA